MATKKKPAKPATTHQRKPPRLTVARVKRALEAGGGIRSLAAAKLGVHRSSITRFCQAHPELAKFEQEIIEDRLDFTEAKLFENIRDGKERSITYYLDCKGQSRGYGVRKMAFSDDEGNIQQPSMLVAPKRELTAEDWHKNHAPAGTPTIQ